jgi:glycerophosphoryl diester phosphodiesterase
MHDGNAKRTCGVDRHLRTMTLEEIKTLEAAYTEKFGDKFVGQGVGVPTLRELCQLVDSKRPGMALGVEIKEYTEETVDLTVELLKKYGVFDRCWFYAFNARIIRYIKEKYNKPGEVYLGLVHRLDRPTGGVMVFAKNSKSAARLSQQIVDGVMQKRYLTTVLNCPKEPKGELVNYLKKRKMITSIMVYVH